MRLDSRRVARNFGDAAKRYDQYAALQRDIALQLRQQWPSLPSQSTAVDLGCGTGHDSEWLSREHRLHLVDIAPEMVAAAAERCAVPAQQHCCDVSEFGQLGLDADAIWTSSMLQWAVDMPAAARAIAESLKPGGSLLASLFTQGSLGELAQAWAAVDNEQHVLPLPPIEGTRQAFAAAGFHITWEQPFSRQLYFGSVAEIGRHLRGLGATNALQQRKKGLMGRQQLARLTEALEPFRDERGIALTWNAWLFKAEKVKAEKRI
jgi:malonyl-CoA O-methyltransferase